MAQLATTLEAGTASGILAYSDNIYDKAQSNFISNLLSLGDKVQDVQVNGQSVVEDKVAKIDLTSYATSDTISSLNTRITQDEVQINTVSGQVTKLDDRVTTIKDSIPSKTSQLTNDSGYLTEHQSLADYAKTADVNTALAAKADATELAKKQDTLVSGTSIKTINGLDLLGEGNITIEGGGSGGSGTVTGVSVNGAAAISPDSSGIVKLTDVGSAATIASQAATIANLQTLIDKYKPHWWAWVTCSHEVNIQINDTTITLPEGRSKIEDFESVMYDSSDMTKFVDGITGFDIYSTGSWPLTRMQLGTFIDKQKKGANNIARMNLTNACISDADVMYGIFCNCSSLTSVGDLSNWDTSNVTDMSSMFCNCSSLTSVGDPSNWDTSNVKNMSNIFCNCSSLTSVGDLSKWNTSKVTSMNGTFSGCSSLTSVGDLSNWDTSKVNNMGGMFYHMSSLTSLGDLSNWDTSNVTDMSNMFCNCSSLTSVGDLSNWDTSKVKNMGGMFYQMSSLTSLNLSGWDLSSCTNISDMFKCWTKPKLSNLILGEGFGKIPSGLTLDLSWLNQYGNDNYSAYVLSDESWESFKTMYDRDTNGLPAMTIKFTAKHKTNYADWDSFVEYMTARGYNITTA